ncbi:hypothetical protein [Candidatus Foliamicus sp.]
MHESTMQPFAPGDIFLGCTLLNDPDDDHAGIGRILQYDADCRPKGVLYTEGTRHLVGGLAFDRQGTLWAFDDHRVIHVDPRTGRQMPEKKFLPRVYRSASFSSDGMTYLGEHLNAKAPPPGIEKLTTIEFPRIPDDGALGYGNIYRYKASWELDRVFEVDNAPEPTRFKGVTHSTLHPGERFITYTTELGKRVMRYDVVEGRQMADLVTYPGEDISNGLFAIAVRYLPDGKLLLTRGQFMEMLDENGDAIREYALPEYGWSDIAVCSDPRYALVSNIFSGIMLKVNLMTGEFAGRIDTGQRKPLRALAGVAEFPG